MTPEAEMAIISQALIAARDHYARWLLAERDAAANEDEEAVVVARDEKEVAADIIKNLTSLLRAAKNLY